MLGGLAVTSLSGVDLNKGWMADPGAIGIDSGLCGRTGLVAAGCSRRLGRHSSYYGTAHWVAHTPKGMLQIHYTIIGTWWDKKLPWCAAIPHI